jgi:GT2 family glycosyltransferase
MARTTDHLSLNPNVVLRRLRWLSNWHIPPFFQRALPRPVTNGFRELKGRILTRNFHRHIEFEQSIEDVLASASVSVVVPVHDAPTVTRRCLASLEQYAPNAEVIVVNDGSSLAATRDMIEDFRSRNGWKIVNHEKPVGHSAACGAGAGLATRPYLCLLNSDTVVTPWCWRLAKQVFDDDQDIAVAGPSTSNSGNTQTLPLAAELRSYWNNSQICDFAKCLFGESEGPIVADLPWASGFAFFIRRSLWERLGGFDRNLPDYGNEVELCKRVAEKGYRTVWIRNAYIHHLGQQSYKETIGRGGILARIRAAQIYTKQKGHTLDL